MCTYSSPTEDRELAIIRKMYPLSEIVDPGQYEDNEEKTIRGMEFCLELVAQCDLLVFSRILGQVTAGVGKEIKHALRLNKPVFELAGDSIVLIRQLPKHASREKSRALYGDWRRRNISYRY